MTGYIFEHDGSGYAPEGKVCLLGIIFNEHNKKLEADELLLWATQPEKFQGYIKGDTVTTWLGTVIGTITKHNIYRNNLGKITSITMRGTNGCIYYGRYGSDWSQLCRFRKAKRR